MIKKALFLRPDHIGDYILTTPVFHAFKKGYPEIETTLLCGSWNYDFAKLNPFIDNVLICDFPWLDRSGKNEWRNLLKSILKIRKQKFDVIFNFRIAAKTGAFAFLAGGNIYGFDVRKSKWSNNVKVHYDLNKHVVDNYLSLIERFGAKSEHNGPELFLEENTDNLVKTGMEISKDYIIISPGAGYPSKLWYADRWKEVLNFLIEKFSYNVYITGNRNEFEYNESLINGLNSKRIKNIAGKINLLELSYLVRGSRFVICVDSAVLHISVAVKTPVLALFGPTNPVNWGPYPNGQPNDVVIADVECQFCKIYDCDHRTCMKQISVPNVIEKIEKLYSNL